jgi:hypothetical protein
MSRARLVAAVAGVALLGAMAGPVWVQGVARDIAVEAMRSERRVALVIGNGAYPTALYSVGSRCARGSP